MNFQSIKVSYFQNEIMKSFELRRLRFVFYHFVVNMIFFLLPIDSLFVNLLPDAFN